MCSRTGVLFPEFPPMAVVFFGQLLAQAVSFSLDGGQCFLELFVFVFDDTAFFFQTVQFALQGIGLVLVLLSFQGFDFDFRQFVLFGDQVLLQRDDLLLGRVEVLLGFEQQNAQVVRFLLGIGYFFTFQFGNGRLVVEAAQLVEDADSFRIEGPFAFCMVACSSPS